MVGFLGRQKGSVGGQGEMDTRETIQEYEPLSSRATHRKHLRDKIGLELVQIDVQGTIETQRSGDGGDDLGDQPVQVGETGRHNTEFRLADVVNGLIVNLAGLSASYVT